MLTRQIGWGMVGGFVISHERSALEVCDRFLHRRLPVSSNSPALSCEQFIVSCSAVIGPGDVTRAIEHADVRAAIAAAPVLYGNDSRPVDGSVLRVEIGSAVIEVGGDCFTPDCRSVPPGVSALAELLKAVTKQQLAQPPCSMTFPPKP